MAPRFLDHYRQFEALTEEEVNARKRARAAAEKAQALQRVEPVDLSKTTWPGLPHAAIVNAITYAARRGLHRYVDPHAGELRAALAHRHGVETERVAVGNGAAQLIAKAVAALVEPGDELVCPWPTYSLYPVAARRHGAAAVPVPGFSVDGLLSAVNERTRVVVVCNPNDPTGELLERAELARLAAALPERVALVVDEALVDFVSAQAHDANVALLADHPRLLLFRTFSKAWGLAGLRCGYVLGAPGTEALLESLEPELGVNDLAQAGALEALRSTELRIAERGREVAEQRDRALAAARRLGLDAPASQANVVWLRAPGLDGAELARRLEERGVIVQSGGALGQADRIRAATQRVEEVDRLVAALEHALDHH